MPGFHRSVAIDLFEQTSVYVADTDRLHVKTYLLGVSKKWATFIIMINSATVDRFSCFFFTAKFMKNLRSKVKLKLPPPLKSVSALPGETLSGQSIQLYIHISENINASC